jgi:hypothetical protein
MMVEVRAAVTNLGKRTWPARSAPDGSGQIKLGNHWLDAEGTILLFDDQRAALPSDVAPEQQVEIGLNVTLPDQAGEYILELDLVQEHVAWFSDRGSTPARIPATVVAASGATDDDGSFSIWQPTCLDVHAVPREEVLGILARGGATVLDVVDDGCAGSEWIGYRYAATKPG